MAVDPRQVLAGVLTVTMFVMLGHMIKRDHFDSFQPTVHETRRASEHGLVSVTKGGDRTWKEDGLTLKPCWDKPVLEEAGEVHGYVTFSLTNGPEYHVSQVWREKNVIKPAAGKRQCNCRNEVYHRQIGPGMFQQMTEQVCEQCPNVKYEREGYFITVDIEKGMQDGQEVVFYEDGEPKIDGEGGDLKFHIRTAPHDVFTREGNDLRTTVTITLVQALVGFEKTIKHLDDHLVDISSKGITRPKEVRKFKGEGMLLHFSNKKGDLYVTFEVLFPTSLTDDQKTKIKEILG